MPLNDDILDSSYALCEEFGPTRRIPREVRLKEKFPELSGNELQEVLGHVDQVSKTVWSIAERGGGRKLKRQQIIEELQRQHPFCVTRDLPLRRFWWIIMHGTRAMTDKNAESLHTHS
jgi:hypothetical protein